MIRKRGGKCCLYSKDGKKTLGCHATREEAEAQKQRLLKDRAAVSERDWDAVGATLSGKERERWDELESERRKLESERRKDATRGGDGCDGRRLRERGRRGRSRTPFAGWTSSQTR